MNIERLKIFFGLKHKEITCAIWRGIKSIIHSRIWRAESLKKIGMGLSIVIIGIGTLTATGYFGCLLLNRWGVKVEIIGLEPTSKLLASFAFGLCEFFTFLFIFLCINLLYVELIKPPISWIKDNWEEAGRIQKQRRGAKEKS